MFDDALFLRTTGAGDLTVTETATGVAIDRTPIRGMSLVVGVPEQSVGDTLSVKLQHSTDDSTWSDLVTFDLLQSTTVAITTSVILVRRFATELKYVRAEFSTLGTGPDYGPVWAAIGDYDQWNTIAVGENTDPDSGSV